jgi:hypothetical protein
MQAPTPTTIQAIRRLLKYDTTAISKDAINSISELRSTYTVFLRPKAECKEGLIVIEKCVNKGVKSRLATWIRTGTLDLR